MRRDGVEKRGDDRRFRFHHHRHHQRAWHSLSPSSLSSPASTHPTHLIVVIVAVPVLRRMRRVPAGRGRDGSRGRWDGGGALHVALVGVVVVVLSLLLGGHVERRLRRRPVQVRLASRLEERVAVVDGGRLASGASGGRAPRRR